MSPVTIESTPVGAEVVIDGEYVGITPVSVQTIGEDLMEFRSVCMSGDQVSCGWATIKPWLEDRRVSGFWRDLTRDERRSVALEAIKNTVLFSIGFDRGGKPNCEGGEGELSRTVCYSDAILNVVIFGFPLTIDGVDSVYWRRYIDTEEHCYYRSTWYGLPTYYCILFREPDHQHAITAIHISDKFESLDDFVFFHYPSHDIRPDDSGQMPYGTRVRFFELTAIAHDWHASWGCFLVLYA